METREVLKELNKLHKPIEKMSHEDYLLDCIKKYEAALLEACETLANNDICPVKNCKEAEPCGETYEPQCFGDSCSAEIFVNYFKKQSGLDGDK